MGGGKGRRKVGSSVTAGKCMRTRGYRVVVRVKLRRNNTVSKENKLLETKEGTSSDAVQHINLEATVCSVIADTLFIVTSSR